jgi:hypothetical protein
VLCFDASGGSWSGGRRGVVGALPVTVSVWRCVCGSGSGGTTWAMMYRGEETWEAVVQEPLVVAATSEATATESPFGLRQEQRPKVHR